METIQIRQKIYIESSTISYLTARPTEEPLRKAKQIFTRQWWEQCNSFDLYISKTVLEEIGLGDKKAAKLRLDIAKNISLLVPNNEVDRLMFALLESGIIPKSVEADAAHIAYATVYNMDFLITWNQKHIATHSKRTKIDALIIGYGFRPPRLMTPEQILIEMGDFDVY